MAAKDKMEFEMIGTYETYQPLFEHVTINKLEFVGWISSLITYEEMRKGYNFVMTKLLKSTQIAYEFWKYHPVALWDSLFLMSEDSADVINMKGHLADIKVVWRRRPKPSRRASNGTAR